MSENVLSCGVTRRTFLKATAASAALAALGDKLFGGPSSALVESAAAAAQSSVKYIKSACYFCDQNCGIIAKVVDDVVVRIEGNPDDPDNQGRICARGNAQIMKTYNPWRAKVPLKRTNPQKGPDVDPGWAEIPWDEALDIVAGKLREAKAYDPRSLVTIRSHRSGDISDLGERAFAQAFGTPNVRLTGGGGGLFCDGSVEHTMSTHFHGCFSLYPDRRRTKYMVSFGVGCGGLNKACPMDTRNTLDALDEGQIQVNVDPFISPSGVKAQQWVPIRPGTDVAVLFAMAHVILHEIKHYDTDFIKNNTNAPYLIQADGNYIRSSSVKEEEPVKKEVLGKPYVWDLADNKAKLWDDPTLKDPALEGSFEAEGVTGVPAFQLFQDSIKDFTPEWAEQISTVPAATIRQMAHDFVQYAQIGSTVTLKGEQFRYRPVAIGTGNGCDGQRYGLDTRHLREILHCLAGAEGAVGGAAPAERGPAEVEINPVDGTIQLPTRGHAAFVSYKPITFPPESVAVTDLYPVQYKTHPLMWKVILDPKGYYQQYEVKVIMNNACGALTGGFGLDVIRKALQEVPFTFSLAYQFDELVEFSDIVLPVQTDLESLIDAGYGPCQVRADHWVEGIKLRQPVVPLQYEARNGNDVLMDLADRVGILFGPEGFNAQINSSSRLKEEFTLATDKRYTPEEIIDRRLKNSCGEDHGLEWFKINGLTAEEVEITGIFNNSPARLPLYLEYFKWAGDKLRSELNENGVKLPGYESNEDALAFYRPLPEFHLDPTHDAPAEYDLWAIYHKDNLGSMAMPMENPWLFEAMELFDPYRMRLVINPATAARKGLKDGDLAIVESHGTGAKIRGEIKVSSAVHPDAIAMSGTQGIRSLHAAPHTREGPLFNETLVLDESYMRAPVGGFTTRAKVKLSKV